ncbi:MAG: hypothetical protein R3C10_17290 [Pirellulales bacterium]
MPSSHPSSPQPSSGRIEPLGPVETNDAGTARVEAGGPDPDRLTIRRVVVLTVGVALGLAIFAPRDKPDVASDDWWRLIWFALLAGVALVSPLFVIARRLRGQRAGVGGMLLLTLGFGVLSLVPTTLAERSADRDDGFSTVCLAYCVPFVCLWYLLAAAAGGQLTRAALQRRTPWVERLGLYLALAGAPLGVWLLVEIYRDAF